MKKIAVAVAASTAFAGLAVAAPSADAATGMDLVTTAARSGGMPGVFGNGKGSFTNNGDAAVPAGTKFRVVVNDMPGLPDEIHVNYFNIGSGFASVSPAGVQSWVVTTKKELKPGESQKFDFTVLHYAPWHRTSVEITPLSTGGGLTGAKAINL